MNLKKNETIKPIVFSGIALLLFTTCLTCTFLSIGYRIKNPSKTTGISEQSPNTDVSGADSSHLSNPTFPTLPEISPSDPPPVEELPFVLKESADGGQAYIDGLTFLGDSTTYGMIKAGVLKDKENTKQVWYGPNGTLSLPAATSHLLNDGSLESAMQLSDLAALKKPPVIVITLGVGVSYTLSEEQFKLAYNALIDVIEGASPETKIICNSIYPVCDTLADAYKNINNSDIVKANGWIKDVAGSRYNNNETVYYLDSYSVLVGNDGFLPSAYSNGDGLHLSAAAFHAVLENLRTHTIPN